jgi:hypothetical protein
MNVPIIQPPAAAGGPSPPVDPLQVAGHGYARVCGVLEGIVYWGILAFGVLFPFGGAIYALLR